MAHASGNRTVKSREKSIPTSTGMLTQSQFKGLVESREQELKQREAVLEKKLQLFQETYPHAGNPSDILHLNVGGSTNVAVFRRTLTHFENSMLASQFSGRWDDTLEKTKCGSFFIDQDPNVFLPLLNYLRHCDHNTRYKAKILPPAPTPEFCSMLEYYGLFSSIYPHQWRLVWGTDNGVVMTREGPNDDSFTISSRNTLNAFAMDVVKPMNVTSFTAVFEEGSTGQVGWAVDLAVGTSLCSKPYYYGWEKSFGIGLDEFRRCGQTWPDTILGIRDPTSNKYSLQVMKTGKTISTATYLLEVDCPAMYPHIIFQGKVTISNVSYDEWVPGDRLL